MKGLAFHCHHDNLFEYVTDYDERVKYIKNKKPKDEQELRLRLFKMIPDEMIPGKNSKEWKAYRKAGEADSKAMEAYDNARKAYEEWEVYKEWAPYVKPGADYHNAAKTYVQAWEPCVKAWADYANARRDYGRLYVDELEELHAKLCPGCPWDGETIFGGNK